ncbi:MAG: hypothetical protein C5B49_04315 [Bdellovibrio sp.]|nr:MAG: hypothetical protein C5B49_04315 [Bdellovibrio sp.]
MTSLFNLAFQVPLLFLALTLSAEHSWASSPSLPSEREDDLPGAVALYSPTVSGSEGEISSDRIVDGPTPVGLDLEPGPDGHLDKVLKILPGGSEDERLATIAQVSQMMALLFMSANVPQFEKIVSFFKQHLLEIRTTAHEVREQLHEPSEKNHRVAISLGIRGPDWLANFFARSKLRLLTKIPGFYLGIGFAIGISQHLVPLGNGMYQRIIELRIRNDAVDGANVLNWALGPGGSVDIIELLPKESVPPMSHRWAVRLINRVATRTQTPFGSVVEIKASVGSDAATGVEKKKTRGVAVGVSALIAELVFAIPHPVLYAIGANAKSFVVIPEERQRGLVFQFNLGSTNGRWPRWFYKLFPDAPPGLESPGLGAISCQLVHR